MVGSSFIDRHDADRFESWYSMATTERPEWAPEGVDISRPNMARSYDYWLGGSHNFAVDREYAKKIIEVLPGTRLIAQANRSFMHRALRYLLDQGVRQFLDLGSGIPTLGNVHEVAHEVDPEARVVYVDIDPIAVAHSRQLLADNPNGIAVQADLADADEILGNPEVQRILDFSQPIGLLMVSVLHVVPDAVDPYGAVARYRDAMVPGSFVVITHGTDDSRSEEMHGARELSEKTPTPGHLRSYDEIEAFFEGFEFADPGLVWVSQWRPDPSDELDDPNQLTFYAGVGRKR